MRLDDDVEDDRKYSVRVEDCNHYRVRYLGTVEFQGRKILQGQCIDCGTSKIISDRYMKCGSQYIRKKLK